jgi:hypothetical protein
MHSRAPHPLAEAICELAAPAAPPLYCRLTVMQDNELAFGLLLHVRPRRVAVGLEISVHRCEQLDENAAVEGTYDVLDVEGQLHSVSASAAALDTFARDLVQTYSWHSIEDMEVCSLQLPDMPNVWSPGWRFAEVGLWRVSDANVSWRRSTYPGAADRLVIQLDTGFLDQAKPPLNRTEMISPAHHYLHDQHRKRQQLEIWKKAQQAAAAAAAEPAVAAGQPAEPPLQPDSEDVFEQNYHQLRDRAEDRLIAMLASTLRLAVSSRGSVSLPTPPPLAAPAPAANMAGAGVWGGA